MSENHKIRFVFSSKNDNAGFKTKFWNFSEFSLLMNQFEPRKLTNLKFSPDVWSRIKKFILWWIRIFPLETKFSFSPIGQFSFWTLVVSLTLTSDINLLIEIIIKIHFSQNRFFFQNRIFPKSKSLSVGKTEMKNYKNVFEFSQRRRAFLKNLYSYWIHSTQKFPGSLIQSPQVNHRIHSSVKRKNVRKLWKDS